MIDWEELADRYFEFIAKYIVYPLCFSWRTSNEPKAGLLETLFIGMVVIPILLISGLVQLGFYLFG